MWKVCAVAAQPGHTMIRRICSLFSSSEGCGSSVMFDDDEGIQGQHESSVLLRNVVKPEYVDDPISVSAFPRSRSLVPLKQTLLLL